MTIGSLSRKLFFKYAQSQTLLSPSMPGGSNVKIPKSPQIPVELVENAPPSPDSSPATPKLDAPKLDESPLSSRETIQPGDLSTTPPWKQSILDLLDDMYHTNVLAPHGYRKFQEQTRDILNESDTGAIKKELDMSLLAAEKHALNYAMKLKKIRGKYKL